MRKNVSIDGWIRSFEKRFEVARLQIPRVHLVDVRQHRHNLTALMFVIKRDDCTDAKRKGEQQHRGDQELSQL